MRNDLSRAYLNHRKALKVNEMESCQVQFDEIASEIMCRKRSSNPHDLMKQDMLTIDRARKFWNEMLEHAMQFLNDNPENV